LWRLLLAVTARAVARTALGFGHSPIRWREHDAPALTRRFRLCAQHWGVVHGRHTEPLVQNVRLQFDRDEVFPGVLLEPPSRGFGVWLYRLPRFRLRRPHSRWCTRLSLSRASSVQTRGRS